MPIIYNVSVLNGILNCEESHESLLYQALNDDYSEVPELKSSLFEKIGFSNKKKEIALIESALIG